MSHYDIVSILQQNPDPERVQNLIGQSGFFDTGILTFHDEALRIWRSVARRYAIKEESFQTPYSFADTAKLYAVDALCLASPLVDDLDDRFKLTEFFTVFYLIVHLFDDHVEHRDKFYSKFDFSSNSDLDTQRGAAPFSFVLISLSILDEILHSIEKISSKNHLDIMRELHDELARQTRYFASERQSNMSIEEVLEVKQRQVSGKTLALFGYVLSRYIDADTATSEHLYEGLTYLGSLTQITDDIRDRVIDKALRNANIVNTAHNLGVIAGNKKLDKIYCEEVLRAKSHLEQVYTQEYVLTLLSLPFYPFMINKQALKEVI